MGGSCDSFWEPAALQAANCGPSLAMKRRFVLLAAAAHLIAANGHVGMGCIVRGRAY
jgi:hypothetical protein